MRSKLLVIRSTDCVTDGDGWVWLFDHPYTGYKSAELLSFFLQEGVAPPGVLIQVSTLTAQVESSSRVKATYWVATGVDAGQPIRYREAEGFHQAANIIGTEFARPRFRLLTAQGVPLTAVTWAMCLRLSD